MLRVVAAEEHGVSGDDIFSGRGGCRGRMLSSWPSVEGDDLAVAVRTVSSVAGSPEEAGGENCSEITGLAMSNTSPLEIVLRLLDTAGISSSQPAGL